MDAHPPLTPLARLWRALVGVPCKLPAPLLEDFPLLATAQWRRGGLPPRVGGWFLGRRSVAGIALGRTVFLAPHATYDPAFLLHEFAHVRQFDSVPAFPLRYVWQSLRFGYRANRFEREADTWAALMLAELPSSE